MSDRAYEEGSYGYGYYGIGSAPSVTSLLEPAPMLPAIVFAPDIDDGPVHFDYPLRLGRAGHLATNTQDSRADVVAATVGVLSYRRAQLGPDGEPLPGDRLDRPELGIDDPTFRQGGADLESIREVLAEQEPRADALIERDLRLLADVLDIVNITPGA